MKSKIYYINVIYLIILVCILISGCSRKRSGKPYILIFTKTAGYHHESIPDGIKAIKKLGRGNGFKVGVTKDPTKFNDNNLKKYSALIFLDTDGSNVLNSREKHSFKRYIEAGGGFVGIHAASAFETNWVWYDKLVGAIFKNHPPIQQAALIVHRDKDFPVTYSLPHRWIRTDEWYNFRNINRKHINVLVSIDEGSYRASISEDETNRIGPDGYTHPLVWYHKFDGGRAFYLGMGHTKSSFKEKGFLKLLLSGIKYAIGNNTRLDYSNVKTFKVPADSLFTKHLLAKHLKEPIALTVLPDLGVLICERRGNILYYNHSTKKITKVAHLKVYHHHYGKPDVEAFNGLMGIQKGQYFSSNHWIYVYYAPKDTSVNRISRFKFKNGKFYTNSEQIILQIPNDRAFCCHVGGGIAFGPKGNLFVSTGDNTLPYNEVNPKTGKSYPINLYGYAPLDDRPGYELYDDQRAAGNTNDLRGKILRIKMNKDGSYSIPKGNLFPSGTPKTRPEIYVMGVRNPFTITVDQHTGYLYWGEVGPDASVDSLATRGPRGYDEVNQARRAGFFGWPFFVGDNYPYHQYNYATGESGPAFNPADPINNSRNNDGLKHLPPAHPAFIWYPYAKSKLFPVLGQGSRTVLSGPVYYVNDYPDSTRYPNYFNGKLFIYDYMRGWIMVVSMYKKGPKKGNLKSIVPFMPNLKFNGLIHMQAGPDGRLYILEYGKKWLVPNKNSGLYVIDYQE